MTDVIKVEGEIVEADNFSRAVEAANLDGLSEEQRKFLYRRLWYDNDTECLKAMGMAPQKISWWKQQPAFRAALDLLLSEPRKFAKLVIERLSVLAAANVERALIEGLSEDASYNERKLATSTAMSILKQRGLVEDDGDDESNVSWEAMLMRIRRTTGS